MVPFYIIAVLIVTSALAVVLLRNPLYSAFALIVSLLGVAAIFALLDAHFLAAAQILVYAGAIMVLVVFVLMLLGSSVQESAQRDSAKTILAVSAGFLLLTALLPIVYIREELLAGIFGSTREIGLLLFGEWLFPFELASLVIMAALVSVVMLAKRHSHGNKLDERK